MAPNCFTCPIRSTDYIDSTVGVVEEQKPLAGLGAGVPVAVEARTAGFNAGTGRWSMEKLWRIRRTAHVMDRTLMTVGLKVQRDQVGVEAKDAGRGKGCCATAALFLLRNLAKLSE